MLKTSVRACLFYLHQAISRHTGSITTTQKGFQLPTQDFTVINDNSAGTQMNFRQLSEGQEGKKAVPRLMEDSSEVT